MIMGHPRKLLPIVKLHGAKSYLARRIIDRFPPHLGYVECFGGYASVLLNKRRSDFEHYNDLDPKKVGVMLAVQQSPTALMKVLGEMPYDSDTWNRAKEREERWQGDPADIEGVAACVARYRMSRGGLGHTFSVSSRLRGGQNEGKNAWENNTARVPRVHERLEGVKITNLDAHSVIYSYADCPTVLAYIDPPYMLQTRTVKKAYSIELAKSQDEDFIRHSLLAAAIHAGRFAAVISGYRSEDYDRWFHAFSRVDFDIANHSGQGKTKQRRTESIWIKKASRFSLAA